MSDPTLRCCECGKFTTWSEANLRKFNTRACGYCGGTLGAVECLLIETKRRVPEPTLSPDAEFAIKAIIATLAVALFLIILLACI